MPPVVKNLLMINVVFYIGSYVLGHAGIFNADKWLAVYYPASPNFRLWQIISYMFMHAPPGQGVGLLHILFNMFALVSFGGIVENTLGPKRFLNYYFICGIGALLFQFIVQAIEVHSITGGFAIPGINTVNMDTYGPYLPYGDANVPKLAGIYIGGLVGASGAVFGVLIAFGMLFPNLEMMVIPIPVPIKAKYLIPVYIVIELFLGVGQFAGDSVAHFAHLGGALVGFIVIKLWGYGSRNNFY